MSQSLLTLICQPSLERPITDWLLEKEGLPGFTSMNVYGHGSEPHSMNLIEQVEGRKRQIMIHIHMPFEKAEIVINDLKQDFKGAKVHYWLIPAAAGGRL